MPLVLPLGARGPGAKPLDLARHTLLAREKPYQFLYAQALASLRRARSSMKLSNSLALKERTSYHVPSNDTTAARLSAPRLFAMREAARWPVISITL
jgi:hypothetical protein